MRKSTLDLLDADLDKNYRSHSKCSLIHRQRLYNLQFQIDPVKWGEVEAYLSSKTLTWNEFRYEDAVKANDIESRVGSLSPGVYIFHVKPDILVAGFPRFALYVGISNDRNSNRPLWNRLSDYMNLSKVKKRGNVELFLQLFYPHIHVTYTLLSWSTADLKELETNLHEYLGVPFSTTAYKPPTKSARGAWARS